MILLTGLDTDVGLLVLLKLTILSQSSVVFGFAIELSLCFFENLLCMYEEFNKDVKYVLHMNVLF